MPKINGFEVLKKISLMPRLDKMPVVIVSNLAQDSDIEKARQLGAKEYFVKVKISIDDLIGKIKRLVVNRPSLIHKKMINEEISKKYGPARK